MPAGLGWVPLSLDGERVGWTRGLQRRTDYLDEFFAKHGIDPMIGYARPYWESSPDDAAILAAAYQDILDPGQYRWFKQRLQQVKTLVFERYAFPGEKPIAPEARPDKPVLTGRTCHTHPDVAAHEVPINPETGEPLPSNRIHRASAMENHIARSKAVDDHHGVNVQHPHFHETYAKYLFPPSPLFDDRWGHDHALEYEGKPEKLERHLSSKQSRHHGLEVEGYHEHVYRKKDRDESRAARIDSFGLERIAEAEVVYFSIEGCIKHDAILSAGAAVFSVPSVTLWQVNGKSDELDRFASRYLQGKTVVIVPDSDWEENKNVRCQALLCRSALRGLGMRAVIAAAPALPCAPPHNKQGVDDFLASGGNLEEMLVLDVEAPENALAQAELEILRHYQGIKRVHVHQRVARAIKTLRGLIEHAGGEGLFTGTHAAFSRALNVDRRFTERALQDLIDLGFVTSSVPEPQASQGKWAGDRYLPWEWDWEIRPHLTIREDLRAIVPPLLPLHSKLEELQINS